jgi:hypothetical protein
MDFRLQKNIGRRVPVRRSQEEQEAEERAYWLSLSPDDRVEAVSILSRQLYFLQHGCDYPRLDKSVSRRVPRNAPGK